MLRCKPEEIILHGEIKGIVTDAETNQPLQAATVKLIATNDTKSTGSDGTYIFKSLAPGNYEIQASKQNYAESTIAAVVTSAYTNNINFKLDEIPVMHFSTTTLDFGFDLTSLSFTILKTGFGKLAYTITPGKAWITVNPSSGDVDTETDSINVKINRTGLTQTFINELIIIRSTYLQYIFQDTIDVNVKVHNPIIFNPNLSYATVTDIDGNVYKTIQIGSQVWMAENLKTTKYNDNTAIPLVVDNVAWKYLTTPGYCWYNNDEETYKDIYGALYNWYTVNTRKLCPQGWHIPIDAEWTLLIDYLGGTDVAGAKMQETGTTHWEDANGSTNSSGFTGIPGGYRSGTGIFWANSIEAGWWTATVYDASDSYAFELSPVDYPMNFGMFWPPNTWGNSVRCIEGP